MDLTNLYAGYQKAGTYNRVDTKVIQKALKPYKLTIASAKGKTDTQLRKLAAQTIINRYRKSKGLPPL